MGRTKYIIKRWEMSHIRVAILNSNKILYVIRYNIYISSCGWVRIIRLKLFLAVVLKISIARICNTEVFGLIRPGIIRMKLWMAEYTVVGLSWFSWRTVVNVWLECHRQHDVLATRNFIRCGNTGVCTLIPTPTMPANFEGFYVKRASVRMATRQRKFDRNNKTKRNKIKRHRMSVYKYHAAMIMFDVAI